MRTMRLRYVDTVGFRASEETNYEALIKRVPGAANLGANDVVLFISASGTQLLFIYGFGEVSDGKNVFQYLRSERLRLRSFRGPEVEGGTKERSRRNPVGRWDPLMLGDYARAVGIRLEGIKLWEQHKADLIRRVREMFAQRDDKRAKTQKRKSA